MSNLCKVRAKNISCGVAILILSILTFQSTAWYKGIFLAKTLVTNVDTIPVKNNLRPLKKNPGLLLKDTLKTSTIKDTLPKKDSLITVKKTDTLDFEISKDALDDIIEYAAEDSGVLTIPTKQFILYGKASTKYTDIELKAATIKLEQEKQLVTAYGDKDSTGSPLDKPNLVQGETASHSDTIYYNLRSQKGLTKGTYLQEGEMFVYANTVKKVSDDILYAWRGRFTTCNLDTPHFAFRTRKMKIVNKKIAVSGPAFPEFEGVPLPIGIPFGIYPLNRGRHSGLLPPQFAANQDFGLGLEGLGYYKVLSDNLDVTVRTNIYSYGGWNLNTSSRYTKRYRYDGGVNFSLQKTKILNSSGISKDEFTKNSSFMIGWNHSRNSKARPGTNFSASVNAGSTKFNRFVPNNADLNFQNTLSSSINYSKDWNGKYNLTVSANHQQNNLQRLISLNLPTVNFSAVTIYPFQKAEPIGQPKWYEKLGIAYTGNLQNQVSFYDSAFNLRKLLDTAQWGATHSIPITLSLPQLGPVQIAPSISYEEKWYGQKALRSYDPQTKLVKTDIAHGFYTARQMQMGISANTRIFGMYNFKSGSVKTIRHEIRPNLSLNYKPDLMAKHFKSVQVDSTGKNFLRFSDFDGIIGGSYSEGRFGGVGFGVDNTLEMKKKGKKDTAEVADRKIRLIDGFGFNGSYNLIADSFRLSPISLYLRSNLFDKINITANATLDPYVTDNRGFRRDQLLWSADRFSAGRITNGSVAVSTSFQSKAKDGKTDKQRLPQDQFMTIDEQQRQLNYVRENPAEFADFNIPWSVQLSYSLSFSRLYLLNDYSKLRTEIYSTLNVNGDFSLTPRWKMGGSSYYDFKTSKIQTLSMFISREMHCWQMSINLNPVGLYRSFSITINPKSGILRDLRINRSRFFYNQ
jgi:hypothetical protein